MTDDELKTRLRPLLKRAFDAGRASALREHPPASEAAFFSAGAAPEAAEFAGVDPQCFSDYFQADERGEYPADMHREFGLSAQAFSDGARMRLKCETDDDGRETWTWIPRASN